MIGTARRAWWGVAAALSLGACTTEPAPAPGKVSGPALWRVADANTTIYLFGTIHMLPAGVKWRTPALEQAMAESDALVTEAVLGDDPAAAANAMGRLAFSAGLPPLAERVPAGRREALARMIVETGLEAAELDRLETWAAALSLLSVSLQRMGLAPELGVERRLERAYKAAGKPVRGLETLDRQMGHFDGLSEEAQRAFLVGVLDSPAESRAEFDAMVTAWTSGDTDAIAETFDGEASFSPELRAVLMTRRNAAWAQWVKARLEQPGTVLVAVGAGHLAGADSVQRMLRDKGLVAARVR
ncbi:MAG TPA: TraB/GumN family protein [Allosphingosinicella sp.]